MELGKETFLLKGKELMGYVSEQVKLWSDKCLLAQQREERKREAAERAAEREAAERAAEREAALAREAAEREAALAREAAEREITLARIAHKLEIAKLEAAHERPQEQDQVAQAPEDAVRHPSQVVMPPFDQKAGDIDEYINQFEQIAAATGD